MFASKCVRVFVYDNTNILICVYLDANRSHTCTHVHIHMMNKYFVCTCVHIHMINKYFVGSASAKDPQETCDPTFSESQVGCAHVTCTFSYQTASSLVLVLLQHFQHIHAYIQREYFKRMLTVDLNYV